MKRREFIAALGASATLPRWAHAEASTRTLGMLIGLTLADWAFAGVRAGLSEAGYAEGRNLNIVYREGPFDQLPRLAAELVNSKVDVIFATGSPVPARAAKAATSTIPIVFAYGGDPVADGLVESLNRPGGNVTGATFIGSALWQNAWS
jgi:putative tryptophan/tyrosine transport system substrate-binding protein